MEHLLSRQASPVGFLARKPENVPLLTFAVRYRLEIGAPNYHFRAGGAQLARNKIIKIINNNITF